MTSIAINKLIGSVVDSKGWTVLLKSTSTCRSIKVVNNILYHSAIKLRSKYRELWRTAYIYITSGLDELNSSINVSYFISSVTHFYIPFSNITIKNVCKTKLNVL